MGKYTKVVLTVIALSVLSAPITAFAGGDLGDQAWNRIHEVPARSTWQVSWVSPYDPYEIRGTYDLKIIGSEQSFEVLSPRDTDVRYDEINCDICIVALSKTEPTVLILPAGTQFGVFNDMIEFKVREK
jgi:hypothetical protein